MDRPKYVYTKGTKDSFELVSFDIIKRGRYITTCVVTVQLLLCGIKVFPCGNGDDYKLSDQERLEILEFLKEERRKILDAYPVKTLKGWKDSGFRSLEEYCFPGDEVDEELVDDIINSYPPIMDLSTCTQSGEPYSQEKNEQGFWQNTFVTFHRIGERCEHRWMYDGHCFIGGNENVDHRKSKIDRLIDELKQSMKVTKDQKKQMKRRSYNVHQKSRS